MIIPTFERDVTDDDVFQAFDLSWPGLEKVEAAYGKGDLDLAKKELVGYMLLRKSPKYYYDYRTLPLRPMDIDQTPYFFQAALGLNGSLKEFCLYGADRMLENTYVLPGRGRGEVYLGKNMEDMIHFDFIKDQGKKHRHSLDMFVRGQHFEYMAVAYHETGDLKYVRKFEQVLQKFFETYPLQIVDTSPSANRFQFDEDRDVMSVGWLTLVYISLFYTRLAYEIPYTLAFEIIKRIWFMGIQFKRFETDSYRAYNHHLWERGLVPFILAVMLPEIPQFAAMKERGAAIVERHTLEDFNKAGGYSEHSIAYWSGAALGEMTTRGIILARLNGEKLLDEEALERIRTSFRLLATLASPGERYPSIGDNRGPMIDPILGLGVLSLDEEWCRNLLAKRQGKDYSQDSLPPLYYANDESGFTVLRNGYERDSDQIIMSTKCDCGYTGHNHMDMLSLCVTLSGQELIGEPYAGKLYHNIRMGSGQRGYMYNMSSHNTVLCYGNPIQPDRMYANKWGVYRPDSPIVAFSQSGQGAYVKAYHKAYTFCRHTRELAYAKDKAILIRDSIERGNRMEESHIQRWHLMDGCSVVDMGEGFIIIEKGGVKALMLWQGADKLKVWKNPVLYPEICPDEDSVFPIIDASFACPEEKTADNATAYISLAIINVTGLDIAQDKLEAVGRRLEEATSSSCWSTVDEPDDSLPMVGIAASLYDVLKG